MSRLSSAIQSDLVSFDLSTVDCGYLPDMNENLFAVLLNVFFLGYRGQGTY